MKTKGRLWGCIVYPESAPEDWIQMIKDTHVPCYISPLHTETKHHHHCMFVFSGAITRKNFLEITKEFNGVGSEKILSKKSYAEYLIHKNEVDKKILYPKEEVLSLNGIKPYIEFIEEDSESKSEIVSEMIQYISDNHIYSFAALVDFARKNKPSWFRVLVNWNSSLLFNYLKSKAYCDTHFK